jgi:two-component system sensor histidine kinase RegB
VTSDHATLGNPAIGSVREASSPNEVYSPDLAWLIRLRWLAAAGQLAGYYIVRPTTAEWAQPWLLAIVGATTASNLLLRQFRREVVAWGAANRGERTFWGTGIVLTFDCALLTAWLGFTGGTTNPFTSLYLVHIVLGAVVLNARWTAWLIVWAALCFGSLFLVPTHACCVPEAEVGVESAYLSHMQGMWFSFATAAILISYFVRQLTLESERQRERIAALRLEAERSAHMASLTTLAAGAAHELRTPLGTIAVAAHELRRNAQRLGSEEVLDDASLIAEQVERCQGILSGMGLRLRAGADGKTRVQARDIQGVLCDEFSETAERLDIHEPTNECSVLVVAADLIVALRGLVNNALDATEKHGQVDVSCECDDGHVVWTVRDTGVGMPETVRARALEPFYTTKPAGKGVGLGLFVAHALAISSDGRLTLESEPGVGTTVRLALPKLVGGAAS